MQSQQITDSDLRAMVITTLDHEPDATFERVRAHLRSMQGRTLEADENDRLRSAYDAELANPTGAHRIGAAEAVEIARHEPFKLRPTEIAALVVGLIPFVWKVPAVTPATVSRSGVTVPGSNYDFVAMMGGFVTIIIGIVVVRQAISHLGSRPLHLAVSGVILLLGLFQALLGLGVLHRIGLFGAM